MDWDTLLDAPAVHSCLAMLGVGVLWLAALAIVIGWPVRRDAPEEMGTGDMGSALRDGTSLHRVPDGGVRPAGDPGPRRVGGEVDEASGLPRPA